jgi:hypothetical protein
MFVRGSPFYIFGVEGALYEKVVEEMTENGRLTLELNTQLPKE